MVSRSFGTKKTLMAIASSVIYQQFFGSWRLLLEDNFYDIPIFLQDIFFTKRQEGLKASLVSTNLLVSYMN